jgi:hypothetical protein
VLPRDRTAYLNHVWKQQAKGRAICRHCLRPLRWRPA